MEAIYKICSKCKIPKNINEFGKNKKSKDGYRHQCKKCRNEYEYGNKEKRKDWYNNNQEKMLIYGKNYREVNKKPYDKEKRHTEYLKNKNKENEKSKEWYGKNKVKISEYRKEYLKENPIDKHERNTKRKEKFISDKLYKLTHNIRGLVWNAFKNKGYKKNCKTAGILGCSFEELKIYIENKFESWMTWDNYGVYTGNFKEHWQIDHIIPLASAKTEEDIIRLNHYTNLQPLDSYINQKIKRDKIVWEM